MTSRLAKAPERLLARLWKDRASRETVLRATNGRRFRALYAGREGTSAGPDFRDAILQEEGVGLTRGDVELHRRLGDWEAHGHGGDTRYNGVVLHGLAGEETGETVLERGARVPAVSLEPLARAEPGPRGSESYLWVLLRGHGYLPPRDLDEMGALLDKAGGSRFLGHSRFYHRLLGEEEPDQVLHAALMEALGYSQNRAPFLELAYLAPYEHLMEVAAVSRREGRAGALGQALLQAAGLGPGGDGVAPPRGPLGPGSQAGPGGQVPLSWNLFRVRPANHPRRRIDGYARMLERFLPLSGGEPRGGEGGAGVMGTSPCPAARSLGAALGVEARWRYRGLADGLTGLASWAWGSGGAESPWRFLEGSLAVAGAELEGSTARGQGKPAPIGRERARDMAVNCVLPFVHGLAQVRGDQDMARLCLKAYSAAPGLQDNQVTREMAGELFCHLGRRSGTPGAPKALSWGDALRGARRQQGLLHLGELAASPGVSRPRVAPGPR